MYFLCLKDVKKIIMLAKVIKQTTHLSCSAEMPELHLY